MAAPKKKPKRRKRPCYAGDERRAAAWQAYCTLPPGTVEE